MAAAACVKSVTFRVTATPELRTLLEAFRGTVNEAIRLGYEHKPRTRFQLILMAYDYLKERYGLHTHYILSACECAFAMLRNRRWRERPYARHLFLKLDNQTYRLNYMMLRIPVKPREFMLIPLKGGDYQLSFLRDPALKRGSITLTPSTATLAVSKHVTEIQPLRDVAYDLNEKSLVSSDGEAFDLSRVASLSHQYSRIMGYTSRVKHRDNRLRQALLSKYGWRKRERVKQMLHVISKKVVEKAKATGSSIVMEKLTGILRANRKGNGMGRRMRGRLHRWPFHQLQSQIEYKARWEGIPVKYVRASNTSKRCSLCGFVNRALRAERCWVCPTCGARHDRDLNAARNILVRVKEAGAVHPSNERLTDEGMVQLATVTRS